MLVSDSRLSKYIKKKWQIGCPSMWRKVISKLGLSEARLVHFSLEPFDLRAFYMEALLKCTRLALLNLSLGRRQAYL